MVARTRPAALAVMLAAACLVLSARGEGGGKDDKKKDDGKTVTVTIKNDGGTVKLARGDTLEVRLEANPTTGFSWLVGKINKDLLKEQGKPVFERPKDDKKPPIGAPSTQVMRFRAEAPGKGDLELEYKRPFEKDKAPAKTFKVMVEIN